MQTLSKAGEEPKLLRRQGKGTEAEWRLMNGGEAEQAVTNFPVGGVEVNERLSTTPRQCISESSLPTSHLPFV
ncbi:hypothetical protein L2E82_37514 [Cichorium intybus]|uniref:Uncharacterized protein n=1 Tax=Cichorium intybus TaxID=13427 RepID=A0ACB9AF31_CICIN|nr:hypothetical protein L2E82_37514 [Cichorium intybus]